jgi:hypothetical protein
MKKSRKEIKSRREGKRGTQRKKKKPPKFTTMRSHVILAL